MAGLLDTGGHELKLWGDIGGRAQGVYPDLFKPGSHGQESIACTSKALGVQEHFPSPRSEGASSTSFRFHRISTTDDHVATRVSK